MQNYIKAASNWGAEVTHEVHWEELSEVQNFQQTKFRKKENKLGKKDNFSLPKIKSNGICLSKEV